MSVEPSINTPQRRFTPVGPYRIHSLHLGEGSPVVLLHGLSGSARWWQNTVPALATRFAVHVPELAGFGRSRPAMRAPRIPDLAALLVEWLEQSGLPKAHLVGHSMGGQIAVHVAATNPEYVNRLVLVDAAGVPRPLSLSHIARFLAELVPPRAWGAPAFIPTMARDALRTGPTTLLRTMWNLLGDDITPLLPRLSCPTLVIWGELDPLTPLWQGRLLASGIRGARLVVLSGAAHNSMVDRPTEFNRALLDFLSS